MENFDALSRFISLKDLKYKNERFSFVLLSIALIDCYNSHGKKNFSRLFC